jgi:hypothetical protein
LDNSIWPVAQRYRPLFALLDEQFLMEAAWEAGGPPAASLPIVLIQGCASGAWPILNLGMRFSNKMWRPTQPP